MTTPLTHSRLPTNTATVSRVHGPLSPTASIPFSNPTLTAGSSTIGNSNSGSNIPGTTPATLANPTSSSNANNPSTTANVATTSITQLYTPPEAFGVVAPGIYRSDTMQAEHLPFLRSLRLRAIVMLSPEKLSRAATHFIEEENIRLEHIGLRAWKPDNAWRPVSDELLKEGMELLLDALNHPILIMCTTGIHETGMLVGCMRRLQHWSFTAIITEYRAYCGSKARYMNEQFIERFDLDLITLPENLPTWFMLQRQMLLDDEDTFYEEELKQMVQTTADPSVSE